MVKNSINQRKKQHKAPWLKDYQWKPGKSGNPKGRPPGKTLKEWAKDFLLTLPDEKKLEFLREIEPDVVWKMAEGNPSNEIEHKGKITISSLLDELDGKGQSETGEQGMEGEPPLQDKGQE